MVRWRLAFSYEEALRYGVKSPANTKTRKTLLAPLKISIRRYTTHATTQLMAYSLEDESRPNCFLCNKQENHLGEKRIS